MDFTVSKRNALFKKITGIEKTSYIDFKKVIGKGVQGVVFSVSYKGHVLVVKESNINKKDAHLVSQMYSKKARSFPIFIENIANQLVRELVLQKICPNFVLNYTSVFTHSKVVYYNEYINHGTFVQWAKERHSIKVWRNMLFQILAGLYSMRKYFNMTHNDLHNENILVQRVKPGGYWVYKMNNVNYYVQNLGFIVCISDLGFAWIPKKMQPSEYTHNYNVCQTGIKRICTDIVKFKDSISKILKKVPNDFLFKTVFLTEFEKLVDYKNKKTYTNSVINIIERLYNNVIYEPFKDCDDNPNYCYNQKKYVSGERIETYNMSKKLKITKRFPKELHSFVRE